MQLASRKILILGASGYIGSVLARDLSLESDVELGLYARDPAAIEKMRPLFNSSLPRKTAIRTFDGELDAQHPCLSESWDQAIFLISMDHTRSGVSISETLRVNVETAWTALNELSRRGLKTWLYFSTQQVYGRFGSEVTETAAAKPLNIYGLTHKMVEDITSHAHRTQDLSGVSVRLSNAYGPPGYADPRFLRFAISELAAMALQTGQIRLKTDGSPQRDFIATTDVVAGVRLLLEAPKNQLGEGLFNLGSGRTWTLAEVAQVVASEVERLTGRRVETIGAGGETTFPAPSTRFVYDISRLRSLGFRPRTELNEGIRDMLSALSEARERWFP